MRLLFSLVLAMAPFSFAVAQSSPVVRPDRSVTFQFAAKDAEHVFLRGQWSKSPIELARVDQSSDMWSVTTEAIPAGVWEYRFEVDGLTVIDPSNPALKPQRRPNTNVLHVPDSPPKPWDFQDIPHGTVHHHNYMSKSLGRVREVSVYTPPGYESSVNNRYPLLVLQHGSGDNHLTWVSHGKAHWILDSLIAQRKSVPMIVMMIDGHPLGQVDRNDAEARDESLAAFERELIDEAMPLVDSLYRVNSDRELRGIVGLSMGGWQAINIGFGNLDKFTWIGSFSGAAEPATLSDTLSNPTETNQQTKLVWIACGKDDFLLDRNQALIDAFKQHGINHQWHLTDGDHSWPVWRIYLNDFLPKLFKAE